MNVNKKILEYLKKERISQSGLAQKTGITQQNLNRLLNSENMKVSQMIEIAEALEVPSTFFLDDGKAEINKVEMDKAFKRIAELEEMLKDKKRIIEEREENDKHLLLHDISTLLDSEFPEVKPNIKKDIMSHLKRNLGHLDKHVGSPIDFTTDKYTKPAIIKELADLIKKAEKKKL